jgi:transcriptional regulator GlxA family with amidase domain
MTFMRHFCPSQVQPLMSHQVTMLAYRGAQMLDIAGPLEVFARASRWMDEHPGLTRGAYEVELVAVDDGPLRMSNGLSIGVSRPISVLEKTDTFLVTGGIGWEDASKDPRLIEELRRLAACSSRVGSVCTGSLVLASAGLLAERSATTHWAYLDTLARIEPTCRVDRDSIFVRSDNIFTSAGVTAGIDMALALVESDHGRAVALHVAQQLVMYLRRPGNQAQFSRHLAAELKDSPFAQLEIYVIENLSVDLRVPALAARTGLSERQFVRRFAAETGHTPAAWVRTLRLERARQYVEQGRIGLKEVARRCGYGDEQSLRRAFQQQLGVLPSDYASRFV